MTPTYVRRSRRTETWNETAHVVYSMTAQAACRQSAVDARYDSVFIQSMAFFYPVLHSVPPSLMINSADSYRGLLKTDLLINTYFTKTLFSQALLNIVA